MLHEMTAILYYTISIYTQACAHSGTVPFRTEPIAFRRMECNSGTFTHFVSCSFLPFCSPRIANSSAISLFLFVCIDAHSSSWTSCSSPICSIMLFGWIRIHLWCVPHAFCVPFSVFSSFFSVVCPMWVYAYVVIPFLLFLPPCSCLCLCVCVSVCLCDSTAISGRCCCRSTAPRNRTASCLTSVRPRCCLSVQRLSKLRCSVVHSYRKRPHTRKLTHVHTHARTYVQWCMIKGSESAGDRNRTFVAQAHWWCSDRLICRNCSCWEVRSSVCFKAVTCLFVTVSLLLGALGCLWIFCNCLYVCFCMSVCRLV